MSALSIPNTYEHSQCKVAEGIKIMLKIAATMFTWFAVVPWRRWFLETFLFCACTHCNADWMLLHKQLIWLLCIRHPFDKYCSCNLFAQGEDLSLKNIYLIYLHIILHSLKTCWQHWVILQCQLLQGCEFLGSSVLHRNKALADTLPFGCNVIFHLTKKAILGCHVSISIRFLSD